MLLLVAFLCFHPTSLAQTVEELVMEGNKAYSASEYEKAASLFEEAIKINKLLPTNIYLRLGQSFEALHHYEAAVIVYTSLEDRTTPTIYLEIISLLSEKLQRVVEARGVWNKLRQKYPNTPEYYIGIYKILTVEGDNRSAIDSVKRGMLLFPHDLFTIKKEYCLYFLRMKTYDSIAELFTTDQNLICESSYFLFFIDIIDSLIVNKQEYLARNILKQQRDLKCLDEYERFKLLKCYLAMSDTNTALEIGNKLLAINPSDPNYYYEIAQLEENKGSITRALDIYKQLYDKIGSNINREKYLAVFLAVANKYQREGKYQKAITVLHEAPSMLRNNPRIELILAKQYYLHGDLDYARRYAEYSLDEFLRQQKLNPLDTNIYIHAGICYLIMEDLTKAEGEFQKHLNRADKAGKDEAVRKLRELAFENINKPDAEYLLQKYYGQTPERDVHSQGAQIEKPQLITMMALDSFGTSTKINPESDKAYVLVHSQIPFLRFDSNRKIHQVNQLSSGDWELWLPAGTHILKISADGFQRLELPPINFGKKRSYEMSIKVASTAPEP